MRSTPTTTHTASRRNERRPSLTTGVGAPVVAAENPHPTLSCKPGRNVDEREGARRQAALPAQHRASRRRAAGQARGAAARATQPAGQPAFHRGRHGCEVAQTLGSGFGGQCRRVETDGRWHHGQTLAAGQVAEFKVWAELVRQSMGGLHVFLPLRDLGIDGVVHRLHDTAYLSIQVKGRTELTPAGQVHITVTASSLRDDEALVVGAFVDGEKLGPMVLVVPESKFRELAAHDVVYGREYLTAAFELHEGGRSRWAPFLVASERLAERFGCDGELLPAPDAGEVVSLDRGREGFLGESEIIRRLAEADSLNL